jgi:hypothetical protein
MIEVSFIGWLLIGFAGTIGALGVSSIFVLGGRI